MTPKQRAVVWEIQQVFHNAGFLADKPDGDPGERTRLAAHELKNDQQAARAALEAARVELVALKVEVEELRARPVGLDPEQVHRLQVVAANCQWDAAEIHAVLGDSQ